MTDTTLWFNVLKRGGEDSLPVWFSCRYVLFKLKQAVNNYLTAGNISHGSRVLDYGCGYCPYEPIVLQHGARYEGVDMAGNKHADLIMSPDGQVPASDAQYDAVLSIQVLEHVPDPIAYLAEIRRLLRPGGKLILSTHGIWVYHPGPLDLWRWTRPGLEKLIQAAGFRVIASQGLLGLLAASAQLVQEYVEPRLYLIMRKPFTAFMQKLVALLDQLGNSKSRHDDAMIFMVLAERH